MYTCRGCNQSFRTELALELHRAGCEEGNLMCDVCGERFQESAATEDGWHYECPNPDCDGAGLTEDLYDIRNVRTATH